MTALLACLAAVLAACRGDSRSADDPVAESDQPYAPYTNLQVLPEDTMWPELERQMLENLRGLGLRRTGGEGCLYCHVGSTGEPMESWDFASDDKIRKRRARVMMRMVRRINDDYLSRLDGRREDGLRVTCYTCHAGRTDPRPLLTVLSDVYDRRGIEATIEEYRSLRTRYFGAGAYDFRVGALPALASHLSDRGEFDDAGMILALNLEFHPDSTAAHVALVRHRVRRIIESEGVGALRTHVTELMEDHPSSVFRPSLLNTLAWRLLNRGDTIAAFGVFETNLRLFPDQDRPLREFAGAAYRSGDTARALVLLEEAVALNADQPDWALDLLAELRSKR